MINTPRPTHSHTSSPDAMDDLIQKLHDQLETESQAFFLQSRSPHRRQFSPETLRLTQELNKLRTSTGRKTQHLKRLKELLQFSPSEVKTLSDKSQTSLNSLHFSLLSSLESVQNRLVLEEKVTETLKSMLEKATKSHLLTRQRTNELGLIASRVNSQVLKATDMHTRAKQFCALSQRENTLFLRETRTQREKFRRSAEKKAKFVRKIEDEREEIMRKICEKEREKAISMEKNAVLVEKLLAEIDKKGVDSRIIEKAEADLAIYSQKFDLIESILVKNDCFISLKNGISLENVQTLIEKYHLFQVHQGSLSSQFRDLTSELASKEQELAALKQLFDTVKVEEVAEESSAGTRQKIVRYAGNEGKLGLKLYAGMRVLIGKFVICKEKVEEISGKKDEFYSVKWEKAKEIVRGSAPKGKVQIRRAKRHRTSVNRSKSDSPQRISVDTPSFSAVQMNVVLGNLGTWVSAEELVGVRYLLDSDLVVKCFLTGEVVKDIGESRDSICPSLIGTTYSTLRERFEELVSVAQACLQDFEATPASPKLQSLVSDPSPRKATRHGTMIKPAPLRVNSDNSPRVQPTPATNVTDSVDLEAAEWRHIQEERLKARHFPAPQSPARAASSKSVTRLAKDENPYSESKRLFLHEFLQIQRKVSTMKVRELRYLQRSPQSSPRMGSFQLLPWFGQTSKRSVTSTHRPRFSSLSPK